MKSIARALLVGAVAVMAISVSAAPSEAAKKRAKGMASGTYYGQLCTTPSVKAGFGRSRLDPCGRVPVAAVQ